MKTRNWILVIVAALLITVFLVVLGSFINVNKQTAAYVENLLPKVCQPWNADALAEASTDRFTREELGMMVDASRAKLGDIESFTVRAPSFSTTQVRGRTVPSFSIGVRVRGEKALGIITVEMVGEGSTFKVANFTVADEKGECVVPGWPNNMRTRTHRTEAVYKRL